MISERLFKLANTFYGIVGTGKKLECNDTVLILGGSNELGKDICTQLCESEVRVINVDTEDINISLEGEYYTFIPCRNFADTYNVRESMELVKSAGRSVTVFINNVQKEFESVYQMAVPSSPLDESIDRLKECVAANLTNVMIATKFFLEQLIPQTIRLGKGNAQDYYLINLSSILTLNVPEQASQYVSSKAALNQFHDSLASELKCSRRKTVHFKTLLVFLPHVREYFRWKQLAPFLSRQLIECLKDGRKGDVLLRVDDSPLTACKVNDSNSCKLSNILPKWK